MQERYISRPNLEYTFHSPDNSINLVRTAVTFAAKRLNVPVISQAPV